jgi:selenide, water dikinase
LCQLPQINDPRLLVGSATCDDAGVFRIARDLALVQTVDFFTPIVDDPFLYGQIAAANSLSDVYAMGGRPLTAMNIMGMPIDLVPAEAIQAILRGAAAKTKEAGCVLLGGHSIRNPEPIFGLSVTGLVSPKKMMTNAKARPGDLLVLTKPLGTGIVTTAIKRGAASERVMKRAISVMRQLNLAGAEVAERGWVRAATDITGFGLLGHLHSMCRASGVGAEISAGAIPALAPEVFELIEQKCVPGGSRENLAAAEDFVEWNGVSVAYQALLGDAQTSGGLLLCVPQRKWSAVETILKKLRTPSAAVIGKIVRSSKSIIRVNP